MRHRGGNVLKDHAFYERLRASPLNPMESGERIPVFDLEAQLHRSDSERWLRSEYDVGDKLHLNEPAYRVLDGAFAKFLTAWKKGS